MKKLVISIPTMFADHHVTRVRTALLSASGIQGIVASAARKKVIVEYDDSTTADAIVSLLTSAGYAPDQAAFLPELPERSKDGSAWYNVAHRTTQTSP